MTKGIIRDIRTGRAIGKTSSLTETFVDQVRGLLHQEQEFYIVYGRCRLQEQRDLIDFLKTLDLTVVYDNHMTSDMVFIFSGSPEELGFAS